MDGPFIFIGTHRIRDGMLDEFKEDARALAEAVQEREPQLLAFNFFLNSEETEASVVQIHPDADSMLVHMRVAQEAITKGTEEQLETLGVQVFGPPNETVLGMIEQLTQAGVPISVKPIHLAGFSRLV